MTLITEINRARELAGMKTLSEAQFSVLEAKQKSATTTATLLNSIPGFNAPTKRGDTIVAYSKGGTFDENLVSVKSVIGKPTTASKGYVTWKNVGGLAISLSYSGAKVALFATKSYDSAE